MERILQITDGEYNIFGFVVNAEALNLVGHHYIINDTDISVQILKDAYDETDLHYYERKSKLPIPKDTVCDINYYWFNFYGEYINVTYNGYRYDIAVKYLKFIRK